MFYEDPANIKRPLSTKHLFQVQEALPSSGEDVRGRIESSLLRDGREAIAKKNMLSHGDMKIG